MKTLQKFDLERMFNLYPETKEEIEYKSNIVDVSHFVGYGNAGKGKDDKKVLKIADELYCKGVLINEVFNDYLKANNDELRFSILKLHSIFMLGNTGDLTKLNNKQLYKLFKEKIVKIYQG